MEKMVSSASWELLFFNIKIQLDLLNISFKFTNLASAAKAHVCSLFTCNTYDGAWLTVTHK